MPAPASPSAPGPWSSPLAAALRTNIAMVPTGSQPAPRKIASIGALSTAVLSS
jgi:hypothetical protein